MAWREKNGVMSPRPPEAFAHIARVTIHIHNYSSGTLVENDSAVIKYKSDLDFLLKNVQIKHSVSKLFMNF